MLQYIESFEYSEDLVSNFDGRSLQAILTIAAFSIMEMYDSDVCVFHSNNTDEFFFFYLSFFILEFSNIITNRFGD